MGLLTYASLCLFGLLLSSPFPGAVAASCARDWMQNQGNCYAYFDFKLTWAEAEIECQSYGRGAHLASVLTAAETALIANYISTYQKVKGNVWIGLHDPRQNRRWRWTDESVYNYKSWRNGQPDGYANSEYCVELVCYTAFKQWNDANCKTTNTFICKYEL
nr:PREDICTED: C-type lectin BpLec-like [Anolis carolinensis]|eukprot:XP_008113584.1 PREDICTED: C-type lectin BpLec-like [Anolis carolinensis]